MKLIRFDWAIKRLLRQKANYNILEGFLSELFKIDVTIDNILESESNKESKGDKSNRVDILVKTESGEIMIVEIQNNPEIDYFHRMVYGASKLVTEYIEMGDHYGKVKKVCSINIVYFDLGQGSDYIYRYIGQFIGDRQKDILGASLKQQKDYNIQTVADIFPRYIIIKANNFDDIAENTLDEWIYFLKNSETKPKFTAKGLKAASKVLDESRLTAVERKRYEYDNHLRRIAFSELYTALSSGEERGIKKGKAQGLKEGIEKGIEKGKIESVLGFYNNGISIDIISKSLNISKEEIQEIIYVSQ